MTTGHSMTARRMLNKVPEVTVYFWIIKVDLERRLAHFHIPVLTIRHAETDHEAGS